MKPCKSSQIRNPQSKRCIKKDGPTAKKQGLGAFATRKSSSKDRSDRKRNCKKMKRTSSGKRSVKHKPMSSSPPLPETSEAFYRKLEKVAAKHEIVSLTCMFDEFTGLAFLLSTTSPFRTYSVSGYYQSLFDVTDVDWSRVSKILPYVKKLTLGTQISFGLDYGLKFGDFPNLTNFTAKPSFFKNASNSRWFAETIKHRTTVQIEVV